ncbi:MAG: transglycosylase SLT domain-containing protein [Deltaproteobacteria bacterium]|nr:transglycosylase SLT domain-containing protein [Deltaproteobacteria bacterium]
MRWRAALVMVLGAGLLGLPGRSAAEIYMYKDARGRLHFSNAPADPGYQRYTATTAQTAGFRNFAYYRPRVDSAAARARRKAFDPIIASAAARHRLDPALVKAVIRTESDFITYARSPKGALGLMQLMPATARQHSVWRVFDPAENIEGGVRHLRLLLDQYNGNVRLALAAYNAGAGAVSRHGGVPPYPETIEYLQRVLSFREQFAREP